MHELSHILGMCGEKHVSLMIILSEWPSLHYIFIYIKHKLFL
jgi:hypothetical protein